MTSHIGTNTSKFVLPEDEGGAVVFSVWKGPFGKAKNRAFSQIFAVFADSFFQKRHLSETGIGSNVQNARGGGGGTRLEIASLELRLLTSKLRIFSRISLERALSNPVYGLVAQGVSE